MQTALSVWKNRGESLTHRLLKSACLQHIGSGKVEEPFEDGIADVLYTDTVIECLSKPTLSMVLDKIKKYRSRYLIFIVPKNTPRDIFEGLGTVVWFTDVYKGAITEERFEESPEHLLGLFMELNEGIVKKPSKVYERGQTTIPKKVRDSLKMDDGDILVWRLDTLTDDLTVEKVSLSSDSGQAAQKKKEWR